MVAYHWISGGGTVGWPTSLAPTNVDLTIPANALVVRFMLHQTTVKGENHGLNNLIVVPLAMSQIVSFTTGKYAGRQIYGATRALPMVATVFLATAVTTYNVWYNGGDNELGFNEKCDYGGAGSPVSNLRFQWAPRMLPGYSTSWNIGMDYNFAVLYQL